jgi:lipoprotein signal peptidase
MEYATALVIIASIVAAVVIIKLIIDEINKLIILKNIVTITENAIEVIDGIYDIIEEKKNDL